jgi:glycosyltransferase involved in cell wall biosynthesis
MTTLTVIIPAYNEESGIAEIAYRVLDTKSALSDVGVEELELLVVDDGSSDNTVSIMHKIMDQASNVRLICHPQNRGYGAALKTGFCQAGSELIGFLDADGTYPPEYFPALCEATLKGAELVIGSRMIGRDSQMPITRRIGNLFFATLLSILARHRVTDSASGMRVFKKELLERISPLPDGLNLTPVMSTRAIHEGIEVVEIPIPYSERVGRSKLSVVRDGSLFLQSMLWTAMMYNPVRILGLIGLAGIVLSVLILLWIALMRLQGVTTLGPWGVAAIFVAAVAGFAGFSIFTLGISFNYLVSLFYKEPIRQGLFGRPLLSVPLDRHFWWMGGLALLTGFVFGIVSLLLGLNGSDISRIWLYMLASAMLTMTGIQLLIYWIQLRVLDELSQRDSLVVQDLRSREIAGK